MMHITLDNIMGLLGGDDGGNLKASNGGESLDISLEIK